MNVQPGDTAIITSSCFDVNLGKVVKVLREQQETDPIYIEAPEGTKVWWVRSEEFLYISNADKSRFWVVNEMSLLDVCLSPVSGNKESAG